MLDILNAQQRLDTLLYRATYHETVCCMTSHSTRMVKDTLQGQYIPY